MHKALTVMSVSGIKVTCQPESRPSSRCAGVVSCLIYRYIEAAVYLHKVGIHDLKDVLS